MDQYGPRLRAASGTICTPPRRSSTRSVWRTCGVKWRKLAELRLQLESRARGLQRDLPRVSRRIRSSTGSANSRAGPGRRASTATSATTRRRTWPRPSRRSAWAPGRSRESPPRRCRSTPWKRPTRRRRRRWSTPRWRLVDELPEGTPADKVLEHWLASARRDDEARGVIWPEDPGRRAGPERHRLADLPELPDRPGFDQRAVLQRPPDPSYNPDKCIFEAAVYELYPNGEEPQTEWEHTPPGDPRWRAVCSRRTSRTWPRCSRR